MLWLELKPKKSINQFLIIPDVYNISWKCKHRYEL
jgi:hypothetical protein